MSDFADRYRELRDTLGPEHPLTILAFDARHAEVLAEESRDPEAWWYLSFVDTTLPYAEEDDHPGGRRWLGACYVKGHGIVSAADEARRHGCNPGGQVAAWGPVPLERMPERARPWLERLLTQAEVEAMDREMMTDP